MKRFKRILVGVDLSGDGRFVAKSLPNATQQAIRQAEWLAKVNSAKLFFYYVLPRRAEQLSYDRQILMAADDDYKSVHKHASKVLAEIAAASAKKRVMTSSTVVFGKSWVEMIREVIRNDHDLVIGGTRKQGPFRNMLFGGTGLKLLRKCPCPVWLVKPQPDGDERVESILVAHDLSPVGDDALKLGCSIATERGMNLHVLHSLEYQNPASNLVERRKKEDVKEKIREQLTQLEIDASKVKIHVSIGYAEEKILDYIAEHEIELIVMGTIARTGITGMLMGNTAEKLLPFLTCSVLAIKPADFQTPVLLPTNT